MTLFIYIAVGLLGVLFKVLSRISNLKETFAKSNELFSLKKFLNGKDGIGVLVSMVGVVVAAVTVDEWIDAKPYVRNFIKVIFFFIGHTGADLITAAFTGARKYILNLIDLKTNIAHKAVEDNPDIINHPEVQPQNPQ